jgi:hypothetical protein
MISKVQPNPAAIGLSAPVRALAICCAAMLCLTATAAGAPVDRTLTVHPGDPIGRLNPGLIGFDYHAGGPPPAAVAPLRPRFVRVDASLQRLSPAPGILRLSGLQEELGRIRAAGGEPLVILDYTPAWLGEPLAPLGDRTKTEPTSLAAWRELVRRAVAAMATGPGRVRWFEAWNEPDLPTFWDATETQWLDTAVASAQAVHAAAQETHLPLRFGGPAAFFPDPQLIAAFVARLREAGLPPAFVSWHYYADYPCLGPDGPETPGDLSSVLLQKLLGCHNPLASPTLYTLGLGVVRAAVAAGSDASPARDAGARAVVRLTGARPLLVLDEWNLSAGGLDQRMDTNVGAAFDAATLITLQQDRLGAAAFYQATDTDPRPGGWGAVSLAGARRPSWWAFWLFGRIASALVRVAGADPSGGLWALGGRERSGRRLTLLLASFSASEPRAWRIRLRLAGAGGRGRWRAEGELIAAGDARPAAERLGAGRSITVVLPPQSVLAVTLRRAGHSRRAAPGGASPRCSKARGVAARPRGVRSISPRCSR